MMGPTDYAPIVEYNNIAAGANATIASGEFFRCRAIYLAATSAGVSVVTITNAAATATYFVINVPSGDMVQIESPFLADAGLKIAVATQACNVTVLRDHAGT